MFNLGLQNKFSMAAQKEPFKMPVFYLPRLYFHPNFGSKKTATLGNIDMSNRTMAAVGDDASPSAVVTTQLPRLS